MQLSPGQYLGGTLWERSLGGVRLTLSAYRSRVAQPWHRHAEPTFFLLLQGAHRDHTRQGLYDQDPFTFVFHPATVDHSGELGDLPVRGLNIAYETDWLDRHGLTHADLASYQSLRSATAQWVAMRLFATAFHPAERTDAELEMQSLELLASVATSYSANLGAKPRWMRSAEDYLADRFRDTISLRDVAHEAGVHPVYLARVFRRRHRCSVSDYLRRLRVTEASRLALQGMPLAHAAYAAGFADQAHFSRCFSSAFGFPPKGLLPVRRLMQRN